MKHPLERIHNQLLQICPDPLDPVAMHGLLTAIAVVPGAVKPSVWLKAIYNLGGGLPVFRSDTQRDDIVHTLVEYSSFLFELINDQKFELYLGGAQTDHEPTLKKWAEAFIFGFSSVRLPAHEDLREQFYALLCPFLLWASPEMFEQTLSKQAPAAGRENAETPARRMAELKQKTRQSFPDALHALLILSNHVLHQHTHRQDAPKNSLCPCGSGKKYKNCCGKP